MRAHILLVLILVGIADPSRSDAGSQSVLLVNNSEPTRCAEVDNVFVSLHSSTVQRFTIAAVHPAYLAKMVTDQTAPDFSHCDMSADPAHAFTPRTLKLFENNDIRVVGHTYATFWRPERVPFSVVDTEENGLHLVQVFQRWNERWIEFLVLYPSDGYWRLRPMPPADRDETAYGSSFLIGPVSEKGRPMVALAAVAFNPNERRFALSFADGGRGTLSIGSVESTQAIVNVTLYPAISDGRPFAALRSMFVAEDVADVAHATWRDGDEREPADAAIMDMTEATVTQVRFGRLKPSRHNTSAPDVVFRSFADAAIRR